MTDTDALTERITEKIRQALSDGEALQCTRVWEAWLYGTMTDEDFTDASDGPLAGEVAAAVLPIVEAEVRAAKAEAWDEAHEVGWNNADEYWRCDGLIPSYSKADTYPNPYHETGDQR